MAVATPSANPSGGLAFGYTFTLTDNFTAAAEKIALSFMRLEEYTAQAAKMVSTSISSINASKVGLSEVTTQVNRLASAFERLGRAKKQAQGVAPNKIQLQNIQTRQQNANARTTVANTRVFNANSFSQLSQNKAAAAAFIAQTRQSTAAQNAQSSATVAQVRNMARLTNAQTQAASATAAQANAQTTAAAAASRASAQQIRSQNLIQRALGSTSAASQRQSEIIDDSLGKIMRGIGTAYLGMSLFKPIRFAINVSDEFERAEVRLKGLLGTSAQAKSVLNTVKLDAKKDFLLNSKDLLTGNTNLISEGATVEAARKMANDVSTLVQVSGGTVVGYNNAMKGIARVMGSGKIDSRQVNRLQTANIPMNHYTQEFLGKSMYGKGGRIQITADEFYKVIGMAADKYQNIAAEMRNTVTGLESMIGEGTTYILGEFGKINSVIYKQLLKGIDAFLDKLMLFSQSPIGNVVIKLVSAAAVFAATAVTMLGLVSAAQAIGAALNPLMSTFTTVILKGYIIYSMLQSNSGAFVALGTAAAFFLGGIYPMFAIVNLLFRAWQTFNDVTGESYVKMSSLNKAFARIGGYMEAVGEFLSTFDGKTFSMSEALIMKLKSIGIFETVISITSGLTKIYNVLHWIYGVGMWVVNMFDGWLGYAVVFAFMGYKLYQFGVLMVAFWGTVKVAATWIRFFFWSMALGNSPIKALMASLSAMIPTVNLAGISFGRLAFPIGVIIFLIIALAGVAYLAYDVFKSWNKLSFGEKLFASTFLFASFILIIYNMIMVVNSLRTAFGLAAIAEYTFLAPILAIAAAIGILIYAIKQLYDTYDNWKGIGEGSFGQHDNTKGHVERNELGYPMNYGNPEAKKDTGFVPQSFESDMTPTTRVRGLQFQSAANNRELLSSLNQNQNINLNIDLDGEVLHRSSRRLNDRENARSDYSHNGLDS